MCSSDLIRYIVNFASFINLISIFRLKLIMTSLRFDSDLTSVRPQNPWTSLFYGLMNGLGLKTLPGKPNLISIWRTHLIKELIHSSNQLMRVHGSGCPSNIGASKTTMIHWNRLSTIWNEHGLGNLGFGWCSVLIIMWGLMSVACKWTLVFAGTFLPLTSLLFFFFFFFQYNKERITI